MLAALTGPARGAHIAKLLARYGPPRARDGEGDAEILVWPGPIEAHVQPRSSTFGSHGAGDAAMARLVDGGILLESAPLSGRPWFVADRHGVATTHFEALRVAVGTSNLELDHVFVAALACGDWSPAPSRGPWRGLRTLGPGARCLMAHGTAGAIERSPLAPLAERDPQDAVAELRDHIARAVRRTLGARTAVSVSGGLDSTGVLAFVSSEQPDVLALALDFDEHGGDAKHREAAAKHLSISVTSVPPEDGAPLVLPTMTVDGMPTAWPTAPMEVALAHAARRAGADVLLSGGGGDHVLDGDPRCLARSIRRPVSMLRRLLALRGPDLPSPLGRLRSWVLAPRARRLAGPALRHLRDRHALVASLPWLRGGVADLLVAHRSALGRDRFDDFAGGHWLTGLAVFRHQLEVASGLTHRDPFFHPDLVRFVLSLPPERLFAGGWMRGLYREVLRGMLPDSVVFRDTKGGFEPGFTRMVRAAGGFSALEPLADVRYLADLGIVEPRRFRAAFGALAAAPEEARWIDVWPALSVEAFLRSVDDGQHG